MKKVLCFILALIFILSLCACSSEEDSSSRRKNSDDDNEKVIQEVTDIHCMEAYVGSWSKERTEESPFASSMTLNADGTGTSGTKTQLTWSYDSDADEITVVIHFSEDDQSDPSTAKLQEDGTLYWDYQFKVQAADGSTFDVDHVIFERVG